MKPILKTQNWNEINLMGCCQILLLPLKFVIEWKNALPSYIRHKNNNVIVFPLKPAGGDSLFEKLNHILQFC